MFWLWIVFGLMAFGAVAACVWPARKPVEGVDAAFSGAEVYKSQLAELEKDIDRGIISEEEAKAARVEISRRLLAATEEDAREISSGNKAFRFVSIGMMTAVPACAVALYLNMGNPELPGQPLAPRLAALSEAADMGELVARVEGHLRANPDDGRGWEVIAPVYMRLGRIDEGIRAYRNSLRLQAPTAQRWADLGEAIVVRENGVVVEAALEAFNSALAIDGRHRRSRVFLAVAAEQEGNIENAIGIWELLLKETPEIDVEHRQITAKLEQLRNPGEAIAGSANEQSGPTQEEVDAFAALSEDERMAAIEGMVDQLDQRLQEEGGSVAEWQRLIRAQIVLGQNDAATQTVNRAKAAFQNTPDSLAVISEFAAQLGLAE